MNSLMQKAIEQAKEGVKKGDGGPFGAVIVKNGKVIASSHNSVIKDNDPTAHAEINAIRQACKKLGSFDLSGCEIYASCKPCPMCMGAIRWANIEKVYFGATSQDAAKAGFRDQEFYDYEHEKISQIDTKEAIEPFRLWMAKDDRVEY